MNNNYNLFLSSNNKSFILFEHKLLFLYHINSLLTSILYNNSYNKIIFIITNSSDNNLIKNNKIFQNNEKYDIIDITQYMDNISNNNNNMNDILHDIELLIQPYYNNNNLLIFSDLIPLILFFSFSNIIKFIKNILYNNNNNNNNNTHLCSIMTYISPDLLLKQYVASLRSISNILIKARSIPNHLLNQKNPNQPIIRKKKNNNLIHLEVNGLCLVVKRSLSGKISEYEYLFSITNNNDDSLYQFELDQYIHLLDDNEIDDIDNDNNNITNTNDIDKMIDNNINIPNMNLLTTFNLNMNEEEKKLREDVILPHHKIKNKPLIYMDDDDPDFEEDDPDDDLDL